MEFKIEQGVLKQELGYLQGIVERKATIPVLANVLVESVGEGTIQIIGTDLDVTLRCEVEAEIIKPGSISLPARKLFDIVRLAQETTMHFKKQDNDWVSLSCANTKYNLAGFSKESYPEIPTSKSVPFSIEASVLGRFIESTNFAITDDQSRFTLSGAKLLIEEGMARMVTTDGYRLAFIEKKIETAPDTRFDSLVPKKSLVEVAKLARDVGGTVKFGEDDNHIYFELDGRLLTSRKLDGKFPNYEMVIPKDIDKKVIFDPSDMKAAVDRIAVLADERLRSMKSVLRNGEIEISASSSEEGEGMETVPVEYTGEEITLGFTIKFMQEFLSYVLGTSADATEIEKETDGEKVMVKETGARPRILFRFKDPNSSTQMSIADETEYEYKYIVMPLRV